MSAFDALGLPVKLVFSDEEIREAFREKASRVHPDSGGSESSFTELQAAQAALMSPAERLREWLKISRKEVVIRGQIEGGLVDLFQEVATRGAEAEMVIRDAQKASSALATAMVQVKQITQRENISEILAKIDREIRQRTDQFSEMESGEGEQDVEMVFRDLVFLQKWQMKLKEIFSQLI